MLAIAAAAAIAAVLILVLSGSGHHRRPSETARHVGGTSIVKSAASYLNIPATELRTRLRSGETIGQIAARTPGSSRAGLIKTLYSARAEAIAERHLPAAQEQAALRTLHRQIVSTVDRSRAHRSLVRASAVYLGIGEAALRERLASAKTLGAVAAETPGHSAAGLVAALVATRRAALQVALKDKAISPLQEQEALKHLKRRAERQVAQQLG